MKIPLKRTQAAAHENKNLEEQAKTVFEKEFLARDHVPAGWTRGSLVDIADYLNGLAMQKYR
ncbi:MAG: hypothetical protein PUG73_09785, partial [Pseudomonadota bacterium]|nr:hypothetical protein [Pseudomonadota bacterium]